jgi:HEAT repeat protein
MCRLQLLVVPIFLLGLLPSLCSQEKKLPEKKQPPPHTATVDVHGKSIEHWIKLIPDKDQSKSEAAIRMVCQFPPERAYQALPAILNRLRKHTPTSKVDLSIRVNGIIAIGYILGGYKEADHKYIKDAVTLLKRFLPTSMETQNIVRLRTLQSLAAIGSDAKEAIPEVISAIKDIETFETRQAAALALGQLGMDKVGASPTVLKALYGALSDREPVQVRLAAVQSLSALGGPLNPQLRKDWAQYLNQVAYKDPEPVVRIWAHLAVMSVIRSVEKERVDAIVPMLGSADQQVRLQAIQAIGIMGKDAKQAVPALTKALLDPEPLVAAWSMWALGRMGPAAAAALPTLQEIRADPMALDFFHKRAEEAIDQINGKKK